VITVFITSLGWLAGKGISSYVNIYKDFTDVVKIIVVVLFAFFILRSVANKWLLKEKNSRV
jgi:membrane protein DedA with SNARE-associated domain